MAINHLESIILNNAYLSRFLSTNDKEPSWDGYIYVYENESQRKNAIVGRVPVQVKGTTNFNTENMNFSIYLTDLQNYLNDGGVLYFIIYINGDEKRTYYRQLMPSDIKGII